MKIEKSATIYFTLQGLSVICWWLLLFFYPQTRGFFAMGADANTLLAFALPDILLAFVSLVAAALIYTGHRFANVAVWFAVGLISYASIYCFSFAILTDTGWLGVVAMFPAAIFSGNFAIGITPQFRTVMFRRSSDGATGWILVKTAAQICVVWGLILVVFPLLIVFVEDKIGAPKFLFPYQQLIGIIAFPFVSAIGLLSAYSMAKIGRGTPLPMDTASCLVISGIYRYVRNPMAISGIGQGILVGFILGSPLVILYALLGALIWQFIYRRLEEDDLVTLFGEEYERYRENVRCWIPRLTPYRPNSETAQ